MPEEELIDIKFRLYDGSDMGPFRYSSAATVDMLKQRVVSDWPKGKTVVPKAANEVKLINSGKILENNKTVGHCNVHDVAGGVIIMHVVVQPSLSKTKAEKKIDDSPKKVFLLCFIDGQDRIFYRRRCDLVQSLSVKRLRVLFLGEGIKGSGSHNGPRSLRNVHLRRFGDEHRRRGGRANDQ